MQSTYAFRARDGAGGIVTGMLAGESADAVANRLRSEGKYVLSVKDNPGDITEELGIDEIRRQEAAKSVTREDVISFARELSVMLETGVPLAEALDAFLLHTGKKDFRQVIEALRNDIHAGEAFSVAMARWPRAFPNMMVSLMKASEASGTMAEMLGRIADYLAKERKTAKKIKGAIAYPLFMMGTALLMTGFLIVFVLPRFARIYEMRSTSLPAPTQFLLDVSSFVTTQYYVYGPVIIGLMLFCMVCWQRRFAQRIRDWLRLNVPIISTIFRQLYLTRASQTMATLLSAGVNLIDIIRICRGVTKNVYYEELWDRMEQHVRQGRQLSDAVTESALVPPNVASMIASGERSGRLPEVMHRVATYSEEELDSAVKQATRYIEPIMIIFMGVVIGGMAIALLLPIFSLGKVVAGG